MADELVLDLQQLKEKADLTQAGDEANMRGNMVHSIAAMCKMFELFNGWQVANVATQNKLLTHTEKLQAESNHLWTEQTRAKESKGGERSASESKAISALKTYSSDRTSFKNWNDKFINAMDQLHTGTRHVMKIVREKLDVEKYDMPDSAWLEAKILVELHTQREYSLEKLEKDMYYTLVEKTEDEALVRVNAVEEGQGLKAYQRLYCWFAGTSGLALHDKLRTVMSPTAVKREEDISDAVDKWMDQVKILESHGPTCQLGPVFKTTALQLLLNNFRDQFEHMTDSIPKNMDEEGKFEMLIKKILEFATKRRLEAVHKRK